MASEPLGINSNYYFTELKSEWPKIYNLKAKINLVNDSDYLYDEVISFLKKKEFVENPDSKYEDFNVFYSYYGFGIEKENRYKYVYMWIYNSNYYIESAENGGALALSTSNSIP